MTNAVRENKKVTATRSSNNFIKNDKRTLNWYKNGTNKLFGFVCFSEYILQIHVLQIHVLQIHLLQMQSSPYFTNPCFTNLVQSMFYKSMFYKSSSVPVFQIYNLPIQRFTNPVHVLQIHVLKVQSMFYKPHLVYVLQYAFIENEICTKQITE